MPSAEGAISSPGLLLCEGIDDFAVILALHQHLRIDRSVVEIERLQGRGQLHERLNALPVRDNRRALRTLGIVCDADDVSGVEAFRRVCDDLRNTGYQPPSSPGQLMRGPWGGGQSLSVGVYAMPDNVAPGVLEDLCLAVIAHAPGLLCVDEYLRCISSAGGISWRGHDQSKARLNSWLASRADPTLRLGQAISAGVIPANAAQFDRIRRFLSDLAASASEPAR